VMGSFPEKVNLISCKPVAHVSIIKLIETETTDDLRPEAGKF